jgi:hypothetical protein
MAPEALYETPRTPNCSGALTRVIYEAELRKDVVEIRTALEYFLNRPVL